MLPGRTGSTRIRGWSEPWSQDLSWLIRGGAGVPYSAEPGVDLGVPAVPGNIYVVSVDDPDNVYDAAGDPSDIVLARSTDNGATWTRSTISHGAAGTIQIMPAAAIDATGNLTVTWYDNRGLATNAAGDWLLTSTPPPASTAG